MKIETPEQGIQMVQKLASQQPAYIKIWYIVNAENPVEKFRPVVHAVIAEAHRLKLRVAVHATELEAARASVEEGADLLVHSVNDKPVDEAFVRLLKEKGTILTPTLVVFERYGRTFANKLELTPEEKAWGNPEVIASLDVTKLPSDKVPDRIKTAMANPQPILDGIQQTYGVALKNLKTLQDAGVTIATGTDAGNIGTIPGASIFREFQLMKQAGLTPTPDPAMHYSERRQNFRRRNRRQDRLPQARQPGRPRHPEIEPARRHRQCLPHRKCREGRDNLSSGLTSLTNDLECGSTDTRERKGSTRRAFSTGVTATKAPAGRRAAWLP